MNPQDDRSSSKDDKRGMGSKSTGSKSGKSASSDKDQRTGTAKR